MNNGDLWKKFSQLEEQEVLSSADLEFSRFLQDYDKNISDEALLAACLTSYYFRQGNVCLPLNEVAGRPLFEEAKDIAEITGPELHQWIDQLQACPFIGRAGEFKPLIMDQSNRLYLHKLWHYEQNLAQNIVRRTEQKSYDIDEALLADGISRLFSKTPPGETDWQKVAAVASVINRFSIISGGPGTGKTSTVVRILALLLEQYREKEGVPSIALAAPTGKAAARLKDSIISIRESLQVDEAIRNAIPMETMTLHQMLGARRQTTVFRHNKDNPLPYDIVIVDEASMIDQALMNKLVDALLDNTRLIMLGDKDQLASVEAGSVMGDLCAIDTNQLSEAFADRLGKFSINIPTHCISEKQQMLTDHIILLTKSYRFEGDSGIAEMAEAVNRGDADQALGVLRSERYLEVGFLAESNEEFGQRLSNIIIEYFQRINGASSQEEALNIFNSFRLLTAHRRGPRGVEYLNQSIEHILHRKGLLSGYQVWYAGKPVIINENDYTQDLHNGDTGVCLPDANGELRVYVSHEGELRSIAPSRLPDHSLAYAMTVHKSQGSEFDRVILVLPEQPSKILTRELLYTAVTRARKEVMIAGSTQILSEGIISRLKRTSGLQDQLWKPV